ncbi:matrixin family metalloprotease [Hymenobacter busanensis]|uniref:Matrixin family metalloprotease n=1 Tax=Hymenobacter busanensis TaxID=2607656 RepID=A0A7L4ZZ62_9BACT|nr:matrixin family metalloprotease [Hymenobacter busanensis]KAA9331407.1 matrixin family metalloprotease [Hymenobacter busanensis]QHJ08561.1 matrixin family metalloprotease [Hymenobacter busanensis]
MARFSSSKASFVALMSALLMSTGSVAQPTVPAAPQTHCLLLPLDPAERAAQAALVVEGEVLSQRSFWDENHRRIYTANIIRVYKLLKGTLPPDNDIMVLTEGGTVGFDRQTLTNTLDLQVGSQGLLFLTPKSFPGLPAALAAGSWAAYASQQGLVRYDLTTGTAAEPFRTYPHIDAAFYRALLPGLSLPLQDVRPNIALAEAQSRQAAKTRDINAVVITGLSPTTITAGTGAVLTINGASFGAAPGSVAFRNADDGGATFTPVLSADIVTWSDTQIQVRVPSYSAEGHPAGSGVVRVVTAAQEQSVSVAQVNIVFAQTNVQETNTKEVSPTDHINQNGTGGYTFRFDLALAQNASAAAAFQRALAQWRCQTTVNWEVGPPRPGRGVGVDGVNAIEFDQGAELPVRILGRTSSSYKGCRTSTGEVVFWVSEIDMQFDDGIAWQFGPALAAAGQFDFESVVVHELGHAQQLTHLIQPGAVMHYAVASGQNQRQLNAARDVAGGRTVLLTRSFVANACEPAPMQPAPLVAPLQAQATPNKTVTLSWTTRDECNVQSYVLERSADGQTWQTVAQVPAASPASTYTRIDTQPLSDLSYYRLRVVLASDGASLPAPAVLVQAEADEFSVFPNPVRGATVQLLYKASGPGDVVVRLYDAIGRYRFGQRLTATQAGLNKLILPLPNGLRAGWYAMRWEGNGRKGVVPLLKID